MKVLPEVCLGPRNQELHFVDDPDYDRYPRSGIVFGSRRITMRSGGLQSLTDCLVFTILRVF